jgi:hypothetical protein
MQVMVGIPGISLARFGDWGSFDRVFVRFANDNSAQGEGGGGYVRLDRS